jgi:hypothetical protein
MTADNSRKGSALLIVLGMMAFMVVSAVGFAVFMRHNRVPSSYLRRSTSSRQLAKAALAEAMARIDRDIGENLHPGLGTASSSGQNKNIWHARVLCETNNLVSPSETVSTLTLEGLAYLPPAMVNDVRYYSRRTPTAVWERLPYDSGRCAFCAIDVSDYFDLGRVHADLARGSGESNLVTSAYLFETGVNREWSEVNPVDFQTKLDSQIASASIPLVSLADFACVIDRANTQLPAVFAEALKSGGNFYGSSPIDPDNDSSWNDWGFLKYAIQRFVVGGRSALLREEWCEPIVGSRERCKDMETHLDITKDDDHQPFPDLMKGGQAMTLAEVMNAGGAFWDWAYKPGAGRGAIKAAESVALCDYLDEDDVPLSIALPTVERTPMITGVELDADSSVKFCIGEDDPNPNGNLEVQEGGVNIYRKTVTFYPKLDGELTINAATVFPFKYRKELNKGRTFEGNAAGSFYLLPKEETWLVENKERGCRTGLDGALAKSISLNGSEGVKFSDGIFSFSSRKAKVGIPDSIENKEDAVEDGKLGLHEMRVSGFENYSGEQLKDNGYLVKYHLMKKVTEDNPNPEWEVEEDKTEINSKFNCISKVLGGTSGEIAENVEYVWGMSLVVQLKENGELVDLVPAHITDDKDASNASADGIRETKNMNRPVLRFDDRNGSVTVKITKTKEGFDELHQKAAESGLAPLAFEPKAYLTDDPRYNHAAENWYPKDDLPGGSFGKVWLEQVSCYGGGGADEKDNDIFMSVSNQGYLQDVGEIAMLPRVAGLSGGQELEPLTISGREGMIPVDISKCANAAQMWRTYGCFGDLGEDEVDRLLLTSAVRGFRTHPYSDDRLVPLAPFVNTPYDWWAAGTNQTDTVKQKMAKTGWKMDSSGTCRDYSFGPHGKETNVKHEKIKELAENISKALRSGADSGKPWYETWKELDWVGGSETEIMGVDFGRALHDVDRKFLCSYWRKCYANSQQLFLVFFRAEPTILGGGAGEGNTPAQLGARGVALVWRNPVKTINSGSSASPDENSVVPHAMRVLFYHQFD